MKTNVTNPASSMASLSNVKFSVYNASAGSGKTFTLAARYIALLLDGNSFRSILAVTFTNKATAEMKQRIIDYLLNIHTGKEKADGEFVQKVRSFMTKANMPYAEMQEKAYKILNNILNNYDQFSIRTIDSFLQVLLTGLARKLHLRATYGIDLNTDVVTQKAIDKLIINQDKETQRLIRKFVMDNMQNNESWDLRKNLRTLCKELGKEQLLLHEDEIFNSVATDADIKKFQDAYKAKYDMEALQESIKTKIEDWESTYTKDLFEKKVHYYITESFNKKLPFDKKLKDNFYSDSIEEALISEEKWAEKCVDKSKVHESRKALMEIRDLVNEYISIENSIYLSTQYLNEMRLLRSIQELINEMERENDSTPISSIPITLKKELDTGDATFLLEKVGIRYKHIMIDEFQDTSSLQWALFKPLIEEVLATNGAVLLVGDVKQSIYRWRNGDWKILNQITQDKEIGKLATPLPLSKNFRSSKNIVDFNLSLFENIRQGLEPEFQSIYNEDYKPENIANYYDSEKEKKKGGFVQVKIYPKNSNSGGTEENILEDMFQQINVLVKEKGYQMKDIGILVRRNDEAGKIVEFLQQHHMEDNSGPYDHLKVVSSEAYFLTASPSVMLLINAMRYLESGNNISLYYTISRYQSYVLNNNISWEEIRQHVKKNTFQQLLPEGFNRKENNTLLKLPLYEMAEKLAQMFLYNNGVRNLKDDSYVYCFFDNLTTFLQQGMPTLADFITYWDETMSQKTVTGDTNGIQILTIHKSKGLEYENIFIPFGNIKIISSKFYEKLEWCETEGTPFAHIPYLPIQMTKAADLSVYADAKKEEEDMLAIDGINMLYVALTRAKKNLFVYGLQHFKSKNESDNNSLLHYVRQYLANIQPADFSESALINLIPTADAAVYQLGELDNYTESKKKEEEKVTEIQLEMKHLEGQIKFRQSKDAFNFLYPDEQEYDPSNTKYGQLLHLIYSNIETVEDTDQVVENFMQQGLIDNEEQKQEILNTIRLSWNNQQAKEWFDGSWTVFRECGILYRNAEGKCEKQRPDRVIQKDGKTIVIDFKFAKKDGEHITQVQHYMQLMKDMGYTNVQGFLWYINKKSNNTVEVTL